MNENTIYNMDYFWDFKTILLYSSIILISYLILLFISPKKYHISLKGIFLALWFLSAFRLVGKDMYDYSNVFMFSNTDYVRIYGTNIEVGYLYLNILVRLFTAQFKYFVVVVSSITIYLYYSFFSTHRKSIDLPLGILAFVGMFYFQSFNLIRYYLAFGIILFSYKYLFKKKYLYVFLLIVMASFFHRASLILVLPLLLQIFIRKKKILIIIILIFFVITVFILIPSLDSIVNIKRYLGYVDNINFSGFGVGNIIISLPLIIIYIYGLTNKEVSNFLLDLFFIMIMTSLAFSFIGYAIPIFGRLRVLFGVNYILLVPSVFHQIKFKNNTYYLMKSLYILYLISLIINYFLVSLLSDGISPYKFILLF